MLGEKQNFELTHVGPDAAAGRLLRSYWLPVAHPAQLERRNPMPLEVLGESLVLFRTGDGTLGLTSDRCAHRGTSLSAGSGEMKTAGRIDKCGIRCPYHGWLYGIDGQCLDQPAEPAESKFYQRIKIKSHSVQEKYGWIWAYLGEGEPPIIPPVDAMARNDGYRVNTMANWDCNFYQVCENLVDPAHVTVLHQETAFDTATFQAMPIVKAEATELGLRTIAGRPGYERQSEYLFPTGIRIALPFIKPGVQMMFWVVPVNDKKTVSFHSWFLPMSEDISEEERQAKVKQLEAFMYFFGKDDPLYHASKVSLQDQFACVSQGVITDRTQEHLGKSDVGVTLLRRLIREAVLELDAGRNPRGQMRTPTNDILRFDNVF
jgi:phenylpropionate dioxygenase-like ring-hydroxylating dioxygenase large terminal subunit